MSEPSVHKTLELCVIDFCYIYFTFVLMILSFELIWQSKNINISSFSIFIHFLYFLGALDQTCTYYEEGTPVCFSRVSSLSSLHSSDKTKSTNHLLPQDENVTNVPEINREEIDKVKNLDEFSQCLWLLSTTHNKYTFSTGFCQSCRVF